MKLNKLKNKYTIKNNPSDIKLTKSLETRLSESKKNRTSSSIFNIDPNNLKKWGVVSSY